ncbi:hypothetical protein DYB32_006942 [Aphanomyces invadans]|uniref:Uncharacterized protein n=1 Tax=Aphanomyces invadans TaxID=157072 RepID=A0A3R6WJT7_9STRA|nr:hypothetical protein DYB32_006942 [Aphanomyces invadans]
MSRPPSWRPTAKAQYQHEYREEKKAEVASLRIKVAELETMLVRLHERAATPRRRRKHDFMLSWQQVALALRTSARDAMVTHRDLDNKVEAHREALQRLQAWVALATTNAVPMHPPWGVANMSLARMPLVKHPIARRHGLDWLTQLMFHNTDAILATYQFPPILSTHAAPCFRLVVEDRASDGSVAVVSQYMKVFHGAIEAVVRCVYDREIQHKSYTNVSSAECLRRRIDVASPDDEVRCTAAYTHCATVRNVAENSAVGSRALSYVRVATRGMQKATCILYRTFVCDSPVRKDIDDPSIVPTIPPTPRHGTDQRHKRCVVVGQSVPQDEKFPSAAIGRKTLSWYGPLDAIVATSMSSTWNLMVVVSMEWLVK